MSDNNNNNPSNEHAAVDENIETWRPDAIHVPARFRGEDGITVDREINLMDYLGPDSKYGKANKGTVLLHALGYDYPILFPHITDTSPDSLKEINRHLIKECAGSFRLIAGALQKDRNRMLLRCSRCQIYKRRSAPTAGDPRAAPTGISITTTAATTENNNGRLPSNVRRPTTEDERCTFRFTLYFRNGHWVFSTGTGKGNHSHHPPSAEGGHNIRKWIPDFVPPPEVLPVAAAAETTNAAPEAPPPVAEVPAPAALASPPPARIHVHDNGAAARAAQSALFDEIQEMTLKAVWERPNSTSRQIFSKTYKEIVEMADESFYVHSFVHKALTKMQKEMHAVAKTDPTWRRMQRRMKLNQRHGKPLPVTTSAKKKKALPPNDHNTRGRTKQSNSNPTI